jgi:hypothetical protein
LNLRPLGHELEQRETRADFAGVVFGCTGSAFISWTPPILRLSRSSINGLIGICDWSWVPDAGEVWDRVRSRTLTTETECETKGRLARTSALACYASDRTMLLSSKTRRSAYALTAVAADRCSATG